MLAASALLVGAAPLASAGPNWSAGGDGWHGSGAVFLPGGGHVAMPIAEADGGSDGCTACVWDSEPMCPATGPGSCAKLGVCAAEGLQRFSLWFAGPADPVLTPISAYCALPGQRPVSTIELGQLVRQQVDLEAPPVTIRFQPRRAALTQLPTIFATGQPRQLQRTDVLAGMSVQFRATATWNWTWGDGHTSTTDNPGGLWPDRSVTHVFRTAGAVSVGVETHWSAEFFVDGLGPFRVGGAPVKQRSTREIPVREARSELVRQG